MVQSDVQKEKNKINDVTFGKPFLVACWAGCCELSAGFSISCSGVGTDFSIFDGSNSDSS